MRAKVTGGEKTWRRQAAIVTFFGLMVMVT